MDEYSIEIRGKRINYKYSGAGPCIVFLHGIPTHSGLWDETISYLGDSYSIYAFDLLGFGKSDSSRSFELNIKAQAQMFTDIFRMMCLKEVVLVGHDIGGAIAQIIAILNPEILRGMVLIDSACYDSWPIELLKVESKVEMLFMHLPKDVVKSIFERYIGDGMYNKDKIDSIVEKYWCYLDGSEGVERFLNAVQSFDSRYTMDIVHLLDTIRVPTHILWGKHDVFIKKSHAYRLNEDIRNSTLEILDDAGHFLPEDQPLKTAQAIQRFLGTI